jgi:hypothetical protein
MAGRHAHRRQEVVKPVTEGGVSAAMGGMAYSRAIFRFALVRGS